MAHFEFVQKPTMEAEQQASFTVQKLTEGLAFGSGSITGSPEGATPDVLRTVDKTIETDPRLLVPIDSDENGVQLDDDGCGDGRGVMEIHKGSQVLKRSLNRAKVFGGAAAMAVGTRIGLGSANTESLNKTFEDAMHDLTAAHIDFGAHTDEHAGGENCGCGAIDKAPQTIADVVTFRDQIQQTALSLGADAESIDAVLANYTAYAHDIADKPYSGKQVMQGIVNSAKVVKRLAGNHREARIVLNTVENYTVNQQLIREVSQEQVQIFAVDVWRMQQIAQRLYPNDEANQQKSFVGQLVYTLGVAAALTDGTLPTYLVSEAPVTASA